MFQTILITIVVTSLVIASVAYFKLVLPLIWRLNFVESHNTYLDKELFKHKELLGSLTRWIDIETRDNRKVGEALKLRIQEKLEQT